MRKTHRSRLKEKQIGKSPSDEPHCDRSAARRVIETRPEESSHGGSRYLDACDHDTVLASE